MQRLQTRERFPCEKVTFSQIVAIECDKFKTFEEAKFAPEAELLEKLKAIHGVSTVETQTYTLMTL